MLTFPEEFIAVTSPREPFVPTIPNSVIATFPVESKVTSTSETWLCPFALMLTNSLAEVNTAELYAQAVTVEAEGTVVVAAQIPATEFTLTAVNAVSPEITFPTISSA